MIQVYKNHHRRCLSVRHHGRVIRYVDAITLVNARFRISLGLHACMLREQKRYVHAWCEGEEVPWRDPAGWIQVHYYPWTDAAFRDPEGHAVTFAQAVLITYDECYIQP